jgi:hypothetical protein
VNKNNVTKDAAKGDDVYWQDVIRTEKGGRARITLSDQSILSVGSQAELHIIKHDAKSQQTQLELTYGKIRAEVTTVTKDGGGFEVKTPTAVAGVIGTVFGTESSPIESKFLCMAGLVNIRSADPNVPGMTSCEAGKVVIMGAGKAPVKRNATPEEYQKWFADTEPSAITGMWPWSALAGTNFSAKATGSHLDGITSVVPSNPAITASLLPPSGSGATTAVNLHITVAPSASPGAYVLSFKKADGSQSSAIFMVLGPPGSMDDIDSLLTSYLESLDEQQHAALAALQAVQLEVQQAADIATGQLAGANAAAKPPLDLTKTGAEIQNQAGQIQSNLTDTENQANSAGENAKKDFTNRFNSAVVALKGRSSSGKPDDEFRSAIASAFEDVQSTLAKTVGGLLDALQQEAATLEAAITALESAEMLAINNATPGGSIGGQAVEQGFVANFNAGTLGSGGPLSWTVCDAGYKPSSPGAPIPASTPGCAALPGYVGGSSAFAVNSCDLKPAIYAVRLTSGSTAWETNLRVIAPAYDDPISRLQGLALAYSARTPDMFMEYFDPVNFPGYSQLQENIRRTMETLSSMSIHIVVDDVSINCNEATVRAEWQENYSFLQAPDHVQHLTPQQMTVKFLRTPGKGWYITELAGDNGTVQGLPPGPVLTDTPAAQLSVLNVNVVTIVGTPHRRAASTSGATLPIVPLGPVKFSATVSNTGSADVTLPLAVQFFLLDGSGKTLEQVDTVLAPPILARKTGTVEGTLTIPLSTPGGSTLEVGVRVNPGCVVPTQLCDASNLTTVKVQVGAVDLKVASITAASPLIGTLTGTVNVTINNVGEQASAATTGNLLLTSPLFSGTLKADIPAIAAGGSAVIAIPLAALPNISGSQSFTATINPPPTGDVDTGDKTLTSSLSVATAVDIQVASVTPTAPLVGTTTAVFNVQLKNLGGVTSTATAADLTLSDTTGTPVVLGTAAIPAIAPGATVTVPVPGSLPNISGTNSFLASIASAVKYDTDSGNDSLAVSLPVSAGIDIRVTSLTHPAPLIEAQPGTVDVALTNLGGTTSSATTGNLMVTGPSGPAIGTANIPALSPGATATVLVAVNVPTLTGSQNFTATISPAVPKDLDAANDTLTQSFTISTAVDIQVISIGGTGLVEGQPATLSVTLKNLGLVASTATTNNLQLSGPGGALATASIPSIAAGATSTISMPLTLPVAERSTNFTAAITTPVPLDVNAANDTLTQSLTLAAAVALQPVSLTSTGAFVENQAGTFNVTIQNSGAVTSIATTNNLILTGPAGFSATASIPAIGPGATAVIPITATLPAVSGANTFTATINPKAPLDLTAGAETISTSFTIVSSYVDLKMAAFSLRQTSGLTSGNTYGFSVTIQNNGNLASAATDTLGCSITGAGFTGAVSLPLTTGTVGAIAPAGSTTFADTFTLSKNLAGADTITCTAGGDPNESSGTLTDNALTASAGVSYNLNLHFSSAIIAPPAALQMGSAASVTVNVVNDGPDDAPANYTLQPTMNGASAGAATAGVAIKAGANQNVAVAFTVPQIGTAPQDVSNIAGSVSIVDGTGLTETTLADNATSSSTFRLLDFAIAATRALTAVQGRTLTGTAFTVTPSTYLALFPAFSVANGGTIPTGLTVATNGGVSGTVTQAPGNYGSTYTGTSFGITHAGTGSLTVTVNSEITYTETTVPSVLQGAAGVALSGTINGGIPNITVTLPGSFPTGVTLTGTSPVTVADGTAVSYTISADSTAAPGAGFVTFTATDAGISNGLETVPAGSVGVKASYSIGGQPNFVVGSTAFVNHGAGPFTGASALQAGESAQMQVVVKNTGATDPALGATVTVTMSCNSSCSVVGTATGPAPTRATPTTLTFSVGKVIDTPNTGYSGTATITSSVSEISTTDNSATVNWDVVDFNVVESSGWPATQNMQLGKTSQIGFNVTETGGTASFAIPITVTSGVTGITLPAKANFSPNATDYTALITVSSGAPQTGDNITFAGTNYGVTRSFTQPVNYYTASMASTTLFSNSLSQPLSIPLNNTTGETLELQMKGSYVNPTGFNGATLTTDITAAPFMTFTTGVIDNVVPGDTFGIRAADGSTTGLGSPAAIKVNAAIPATVPQDTITYNLYIMTVGTPSLAVTNIAPSSGVTIGSSSPWIAGETLSFDITVANSGTAASKGGEELDVFFLNGGLSGSPELVSTTLPSVITAGSNTTFSISLTAPDGPLTLQSSLNGVVHQDSPNNATSTTNFGPFDTSDWSITLNPGTQSNPLVPVMNPASGITSGTVNYQYLIIQYPKASFHTAPTASAGIKDTSFSQALTPSGNGGSVLETLTNTFAVAGNYIGQVTANIGTVTRQSTIYINYATGGAEQAVSLLSSGNNIAAAPTDPSTLVQINGYVGENVTLTGNRTTGTNCSGAQTQCTFTLTLTPDTVASSVGGNGEGDYMTYGIGEAYTFSGTLDPALGTLNPGTGYIMASVTSAQTSGTKRRGDTYPTPIGDQQWILGFTVADLDITFPSCVSVPPGTTLSVPLAWSLINGYNGTNVDYQWQDQNFNPVGSSVISPASASGVNPTTGNLTFNFTNSASGTNPAGETYYLVVTLKNSSGTPGPFPKYFPVGVDLTATGGYCGASSPTNPVHGTHRAVAPVGKQPVLPSQLQSVKIAGVYGRQHLSSASKTARKAGPLPDVQIAASDVTYTPSLPKNGDTVEIRFRMKNAGRAEANDIPISLVVNGSAVASDTFDLKAGASSLGALHWRIGGTLPKPANGVPTAQLAVDPQHTMMEQSTTAKTAVLAHFTLPGIGGGGPLNSTSGKLAHLQVAEAACLGFRFASGAGVGCGSADIELSVEDLANGKYVLNGRNGVADLGVGNTSTSSASYGSQALVVVGHTYAVQLPDKSVGLFTVQRVRNPQQLSQRSERVFGHTKTLSVGKGSGAAQTGDVSGGSGKHSETYVYFDVLYATQPGM